MRIEYLIKTLTLLALAHAPVAAAQETEAELKQKYMTPFKKAYADYGSKLHACEENEKAKTQLQTSDITFLKQRQAQLMIVTEQKRRLSTCIYPEENIAIRKHIETLTLLRSKNILPTDQKTLEQTLNFYVGLETEFDHKTKAEYELLPKILRESFDRIAKDKGVKVNFIDITAALPE